MRTCHIQQPFKRVLHGRTSGADQDLMSDGVKLWFQDRESDNHKKLLLLNNLFSAGRSKKKMIKFLHESPNLPQIIFHGRFLLEILDIRDHSVQTLDVVCITLFRFLPHINTSFKGVKELYDGQINRLP